MMKVTQMTAESTKLILKNPPIQKTVVTRSLLPAEGCEEAVAQDSEIAESSYTPPKYYYRLHAKRKMNSVIRC